ncbi:unnamed protein product [Chilo suppressalis]|uniref:Uncharacterized protein n=1 Tax=Chilo suppressalis TaxID=168631 RepID=A0ABN8AV77_CHISP|nr:unnamed protein product [Chilo suppressalis]
MRDSTPDTCTKMFDMSIQEVNGKGPKKRKKSLERICDNERRESAEDGAGGVQLLHWRDMPRHLQFNPYVLTGYRPLQGWLDCIRSLFYFHNETINILTHGDPYLPKALRGQRDFVTAQRWRPTGDAWKTNALPAVDIDRWLSRP